MPTVRADRDRSVLLVVDVQPTFMRPIHRAEAVYARAEFLTRAAAVVGVPVVASEQAPDRMGGTDPRLLPYLPLGCRPFAKTSFGCVGCEGFMGALEGTGRKQAVIVGIETHICVTQTALGLLDRGYEVIIGGDAIGARSPMMHELGSARLSAAGAVIAHTESVVYEWLASAEHPRFRDALELVKEYSAKAEPGGF